MSDACRTLPNSKVAHKRSWAPSSSVASTWTKAYEDDKVDDSRLENTNELLYFLKNIVVAERK